jgi:hypothetical protein
MAFDWFDNFSIYGGVASRMLNGVYAEILGSGLIIDPDPTAGGGYVLYASDTVRKTLQNARTTVGVAARYWLNSLPSDPSTFPYYASFRDVNNIQHGYLKVDPTGYLRYYRTDTGGDVLLGSSASPVIVANAWLHVETKVFFDVAAGTVQVRVEGVTVLNVAGVRTTTNNGAAAASCQNVNVGRAGNTSVPYVKDYIIWDNTGARNNDFVGSCQVYSIIPDADIALNWTPFPNDGIGYNKINEANPDEDAKYISAPFPAPAAYKCSLSNLPANVTSVRGVMPIPRSRKIDGGDGNLQVGLISGANTGLGADRAITTAYTYWFDIYDSDPGGGAWTPALVNALQLQLNRTL